MIAARTHWYFKPLAGSLSCLGIMERANGDYCVIDSPSGTYLSGHADRGLWREAEERYLAEGYLPEAEAKTRGLIPASWNRATPDLQGSRRGHLLRNAILGVIVVALTLLVVSVVRQSRVPW
jgi:hypothetical protein